MNDPGFVEMLGAFRRLAERQAAAGGVRIELAPSPVPHTSREVLALLFGEPHGGHSVAGVEKRVGTGVIIHCSCGSRWYVDEVFCRKRKTELPMVTAALRNAPPHQKA